MKVINEVQLSEEIAKNKATIAEVFTQTCNYCKLLEPHLEAAAAEAGIPVFKLDAEENPNLVAEFSISQAPTVIVFDKDGDVLAGFNGFKPKEVIDEILKGLV